MNNTTQTITNLKLSPQMLENLQSIGYKNLTQIQEKSLPYTLDGQDLIAKAKTGSGKTAAFGIPLLSKLDIKLFRIQTLVLCPTRELAEQVATELRKLAKFAHNIKITTLCGGMPYRPQVHSLSHQAHIIVGTPGRVLKHLQEKSFSTENINTLVLDEADKMLDMGFSEDIHSIIDFLPKNRQTMLFSATYPDNIKKLAQSIMTNPVIVEADTTHQAQVIEQVFYEASSSSDKLYSVMKLLQDNNPTSCVIFCNTKIACDELADDLERNSIPVLVLHSDFEQRDRNEILAIFSNKSYPVLIATDVAARGLDIDDIELVINYDLPFDMQNYTHRIGRTARAGKTGKAISLVDNIKLFDEVKEYANLSNNLEIMKKEPLDKNFTLESIWRSIYINAGKKTKLRAGDIVGVLTASIGLAKDDIGKINTLEMCTYVAVKENVATKAVEGLNTHKIKGKFFRAFLK
jgi:ATP-dependent RNA helicase DbpA